MRFDFEVWKHAVLRSADYMICANDLLEATGLIDIDYLDDNLAVFFAEMEEKLGLLDEHITKKPADERYRSKME